MRKTAGRLIHKQPESFWAVNLLGVAISKRLNGLSNGQHSSLHSLRDTGRRKYEA